MLIIIFKAGMKCMTHKTFQCGILLWGLIFTVWATAYGSVHSTHTPIAISSDGKIVASTGYKEFNILGFKVRSSYGNATVRLWSITTGENLLTFSTGVGTLYGLRFLADNRTLVSVGSHSVGLWDSKSGKEIKRLRWDESTLGFAVSSSSAKLAFQSKEDNREIKLLDINSGHVTRVLRGHVAEVRALAFSTDGTTLASGSRDGSIILWNIASGTIIKTIKGNGGMVRGVTFSPDGKVLASGSSVVTVWNLSTGVEVCTLPVEVFFWEALAISPNGNAIATGTGELGEYLQLWNVAICQRCPELPSSIKGTIYSIIFSPDGSTLISSNFNSGVIQFWDVESRREIMVLNPLK